MPVWFSEMPHDDPGKVRVAIQARADGRAADRQFFDRRDRVSRPEPRVFDLLRIAAKLLPEPHGRGVHEMGAADFDDVPKLQGLLLKGASASCSSAGMQILADAFADGHVDRGGDDVIGRLSHVDVIVRMHGILASRSAGQRAGSSDSRSPR